MPISVSRKFPICNFTTSRRPGETSAVRALVTIGAPPRYSTTDFSADQPFFPRVMKQDEDFFFCRAIDPLNKRTAIVYTDYGYIILNNPPDCGCNLPPVCGPKHTQEFRYNPAAVLKHKLVDAVVMRSSFFYPVLSFLQFKMQVMHCHPVSRRTSL